MADDGFENMMDKVAALAKKGRTVPEPDEPFEGALAVLAGSSKYKMRVCPCCGKPPTVNNSGNAVFLFRDDLSCTEHRISGLCQACQDRVFAP